MAHRRKRIRIIETAGRHVELVSVTRLPLRQRCTAATAEGSRDRRRRLELDRLARGEGKDFRADLQPRHDRRRGRLAATAALASATDDRFAVNAVTHHAAETS